MAFGEEILKSVTKSGVLPPQYRFTVLGGYGAYIENVLSLAEVSKTKVSANLKGLRLVVVGSGLKISKYCFGDLVVTGEISSVEVQK